jgi:Fic family protein
MAITYIYELPDWPKFRWDTNGLADLLMMVRHNQGQLVGRMKALGFRLREEAVLESLTQEVVKSSEIEGEILNRDEVRSSIARRLGLDVAGMTAADRHVDGLVKMMLDATEKFDEPLSQERLFGWHEAMFPGGRSGMARIKVGAWRDDSSGPMQVVSGPLGRERVHYQAPPEDRLDAEMKTFFDWFNGEAAMDPVLKAALAHLWFVTIHPFDDGNGRIARAIADMALARSEQSSQRFYSMSAQIRHERNSYYDILERTQKGDLDVTHWLEWFFGCLNGAFTASEIVLASVFRKARFWEAHAGAVFNPRQQSMLNRLLENFVGKLTSSKWANIQKCSPDTALRDIDDLIGRGILIKDESGGRSTSYSLVEPGDRRLMSSQTYRLFEQAMRLRKQITCTYDGHHREICSIILGHSDGAEKALTYQFAGQSKSGLPPGGAWRCLFLANVSNVHLRDGAWIAGDNHTQPQGCVDDVDLDVNPESPYRPKRTLGAAKDAPKGKDRRR